MIKSPCSINRSLRFVHQTFLVNAAWKGASSDQLESDTFFASQAPVLESPLLGIYLLGMGPGTHFCSSSPCFILLIDSFFGKRFFRCFSKQGWWFTKWSIRSYSKLVANFFRLVYAAKKSDSRLCVANKSFQNKSFARLVRLANSYSRLVAQGWSWSQAVHSPI